MCRFPGLDVKPYRLWPPPEGIEISPPYEKQLGTPSYEVCRRCGFEFGNDDNPGGGAPGESFDDYRQAWEAAGRAAFHASAIRTDTEKDNP